MSSALLFLKFPVMSKKIVSIQGHGFNYGPSLLCVFLQFSSKLFFGKTGHTAVHLPLAHLKSCSYQLASVCSAGLVPLLSNILSVGHFSCLFRKHGWSSTLRLSTAFSLNPTQAVKHWQLLSDWFCLAELKLLVSLLTNVAMKAYAEIVVCHT